MTKKTIDPIFTEYARTAPLGDLTFYVRCAERHLMTLELSEQTVTIAREMVALEHKLTVSNSAGTPAANKTRVWTLISRFRSSIQGWAGNAGAKGSWVEPLESDAVYWLARRELTMTDISEPAALEPPLDYTPGAATRKKKTPAEPAPEPVVRSVEAEGPVTLEQIAAWHAPALERSARLNGYGVPARVEPLTLDAARAMLQDGLPEAPAADAKPARVRKAVVPPAARIPCPSPSCAHGALVPETTFRLRCDTCQRMWELRDEQPKAKPAAPRAPRRVAPVLDGEKTCIRCNTTQPLAEFAWAAPQARNVCLTCRRVQRRDATTRRQQAA